MICYAYSSRKFMQGMSTSFPFFRVGFEKITNKAVVFG